MIVALLTCAIVTPSLAATKEVKGLNGQTLTASSVSVKSGASITVKGKFFDEIGRRINEDCVKYDVVTNYSDLMALVKNVI